MKDTRLFYALSICITFSLLALFQSCQHNEKLSIVTVQGCMDPQATNYDAKATVSTTCHYPNEQFTGKYLVKDTTITFYHDMTTGWFDTSYSVDTISVSAATKDSLVFSKLLRSNYTFTGNCSHFSYYYDNCPPLTSSIGSFSGDSLYFHTTVRPYPLSNGSVTDFWCIGVKLK